MDRLRQRRGAATAHASQPAGAAAAQGPAPRFAASAVVALLGWALVAAAPSVPLPAFAQGQGAARPSAGSDGRVAIPAGAWRPFFPGKDEPLAVQVAAFRIDALPVTVAAYLAFVRAQPRWRKGLAPKLFADARYLSAWRDALDPGAEDPQAPVREVSWFAARAYCAWAGGRLPRLAEWERVAGASATHQDARADRAHQAQILAWYGRPASARPPRAGLTPRNVFGVGDLHGVVWEWVEDFATALVTGESRGDSALDRGLFCGAGSVGSADPRDYAAFMRFALRSSLRARDTTRALGFRCAADAAPAGAPRADAKDHVDAGGGAR